MGILTYFKNPDTRLKAWSVCILVGGALAYGTCMFWFKMKLAEEVKDNAVKKMEEEQKRRLKAENDRKIEEYLHTLNQEITGIKERANIFKNGRQEEFEEAKAKVSAQQSEGRGLLEGLMIVQQLAIEMSTLTIKKLIEVNREIRLLEVEIPDEECKAKDFCMEDYKKLFNENLTEILSECGVSREAYDTLMIANMDNVVNEQATLMARLPEVNGLFDPSQEIAIEIHQGMLEGYTKTYHRQTGRDLSSQVKVKKSDAFKLFDKDETVKIFMGTYGQELKEDIAKYSKEFAEFEKTGELPS